MTGVRLRALTACAAGLSMCAAIVPLSADPAPRSAQAVEGKTRYAAHCASCHGSELQGGLHAPPLVGEAFRAHWEGRPARAVYSRIISTMPQDSPGSLTETDALLISLYVFAENDISTGPQPPMTAAALNTIMITKRE